MVFFTGCSEASEEDEELLTFTLQQYLSFSCSSKPSSSCSSLLSSFMLGCSDTLAMILSLRRRNATQLTKIFTPPRSKNSKDEFLHVGDKKQASLQVFHDAGQFVKGNVYEFWEKRDPISLRPLEFWTCFQSDLFISGLSDTLFASTCPDSVRASAVLPARAEIFQFH